MFEITGDDIARLTDADLRTLVARLAIAELRAKGLAVSGVTAGGSQDAGDGGLDVRVEQAQVPTSPDFVPRAKTGFQVKKPDMPTRKILEEMRPKGVLRPVIAELAKAGGAYVIVSAQGSLADAPLRARKAAMRQALADCAEGNNLATDFYDRERLASWAEQYPGVAAWIRARVGRELAGWRPVGQWSGTATIGDGGYLVNDAAGLIDERSSPRQALTVLEGIGRLRGLLAQPGHCVRLIGLSGLGKTRLVEALFEVEVGQDPLDPALSVYTDFAHDLTPSAREMARRLVESRQRAILIVDNCNPATHGEIAALCALPDSQVSFISIEYDVRDDEPEQTKVFRLASVSPDLVSAWLVRDFNHVSAVDRGRIAAFSDGNFRIARALAETLRRGESLGQLRNKDLFERIFQQRNAPDASLLRDAEILALLYSFDGDDVAPDGELARLAVLAGRPTQSLYGVLADLAERSVLQQRGRWRALLPQALANPLAASALKRIPDQAFDVFCASLPDRMLRSLTRRLGFLHDSSRAQTTVARWLAPTGLFDQLFLVSDFTLVQNLAPIAPEAMLAKIEVELKGVHGADILDPGNHQRDHWIGLLKSLAYDPDLFTRAGLALACFLAAEPEPGGHNSAKTAFEELFHLHLSGTQADPQARRDLVGALCRAQGPGFRRAGAIGLEALLASEHFSSSSDFDFGARPRDYGWEPKTYDVIWAWYDDAIDLLLGLSDRLAEAKAILARNVHSLWRYPACHDRLEAAAIRFETEGWTEGWMAFRAARRFDAVDMPPEIVGRLDAIIARLTPTNLTARARAYVLSHPQGAHNVADGEGGEDDVVGAWNLAADTAIEIGRAMAANAPVLMAFLPELIGQPQAERAYQFGQGLARGSEDPAALWSQLLSAFEAGPAETRSPTFLGGFVGELARQNPKWIEVVLGPDLEARIAPRYLPFLLAQAGWTEQSLDRVTALVAAGTVAPADLLFLGVREAPTEAMSRLLTILAELPSGPAVAIRILSMILHCARTDELPLADILVESGRLVLQRVDLGSPKAVHDHAFGHVAAACLPGPAGAPAAVIICARLRAVLESRRVSRYELHGFLEALLKAQPAIALDALLLAGLPQRNHDVLERNYGRGSPLAVLSADSLCDWADNDPVDRYPRLGQILSPFTHKPSDDISGLSPLFVEVLARAPDPILFLGDVLERVHPRSGAGSAADMLEKRQKILATSGIPALETWISGGAVTIAQWIESYRAREIEREESFE